MLLGTLEMSTPSIVIVPSVTSMSLRRDESSVLFPLPVRPMMPTFLPLPTSKVIPFSALVPSLVAS